MYRSGFSDLKGKIKNNLVSSSALFWFLNNLISSKTDVGYFRQVKKQKKEFFKASWKLPNRKKSRIRIRIRNTALGIRRPRSGSVPEQHRSGTLLSTITTKPIGDKVKKRFIPEGNWNEWNRRAAGLITRTLLHCPTGWSGPGIPQTRVGNPSVLADLEEGIKCDPKFYMAVQRLQTGVSDRIRIHLIPYGSRSSILGWIPIRIQGFMTKNWKKFTADKN